MMADTCKAWLPGSPPAHQPATGIRLLSAANSARSQVTACRVAASSNRPQMSFRFTSRAGLNSERTLPGRGAHFLGAEDLRDLLLKPQPAQAGHGQ